MVGKYLSWVYITLVLAAAGGHLYGFNIDNEVSSQKDLELAFDKKYEKIVSPMVGDKRKKKRRHKKAKPYQWDFAVVTIFQNEAPYLREWIEFHKLVGAEHFYMYNNLSTDNYLSILEPYLMSGEVELFDWPYDNNGPAEFNEVASNAFRDAHQRARGKVKWLGMIDSDEFIYAVNGEKIQDFLAPLLETKIAGVQVFWYMFGTSHVPYIPEDKLMIEMLILSGGKHELFKTIYRPEYAEVVVNQHYCHYLPGYGHEDVAAKLGDIRINHYWTRDEYYLNHVKIPRRIKYGTPQEVTEQWNDLMNVYPDYTIQPYVVPLRKKLGKE